LSLASLQHNDALLGHQHQAKVIAAAFAPDVVKVIGDIFQG
jgi:hypothetical protein